MLVLTFVLTVAVYSCSAVAFYVHLVRVRTSSRILSWARWLLIGATILHAGDIAVRSVFTHTCPVLSATFALSLAALIATISFLVWAKRSRLLSLGVIVTPISLAMVVASVSLSGWATVTEVPGWFLALHVLANLSAVALCVLAAAAAIAYLFQSGRLKSKRPALANSMLPGLSSLETLIERSLTLGVGFMTLGVISGAVFAERLSLGGLEAVRISLSYLCWLSVASLVVGQRLVGYSGRKVAWWAVTVAAMAVGVLVLYARSSGGHV